MKNKGLTLTMGGMKEYEGVSALEAIAKKYNASTSFFTIFNMYLYVESPVSNIISKMLDSDESLEQIGFGFAAGFLSGKQNENSKADGGEE